MASSHLKPLAPTDWLAYGILPFLVFSLTVKSVIGFFWFGLLILGAYYRYRLGWRQSLSNRPSPNDPIDTVVYGWLATCLMALGLKAIPMIYWSGPWQERHAEWRLLLGAIGLYWLWHCKRLPRSWAVWVGHTLSLACVSAFILTATLGSNAAPTNRIPWAAGVSLFSLVLLTWSFGEKRYGSWWRLASFLALNAVFISGVRGSYFLLVVWPATFYFLNRRCSLVIPPRRIGFVALGSALCLVLTSWLPSAESPATRVKQVFLEVGLSQQSTALDVNSSNGARVLLWRAGFDSIAEHSLIGIGPSGGKKLIKKTAEETQSDVVAELGHFHSDYIHTAVEFGIFGLLGFLAYCFGLGWCAFKFYRLGGAPTAIGLASVLIIHLSTSLSNFNFGHNFYPTALSVAVSLLLIHARLYVVVPAKPLEGA